jgi:hypothetical protein
MSGIQGSGKYCDTGEEQHRDSTIRTSRHHLTATGEDTGGAGQTAEIPDREQSDARRNSAGWRILTATYIRIKG